MSENKSNGNDNLISLDEKKKKQAGKKIAGSSLKRMDIVNVFAHILVGDRATLLPIHDMMGKKYFKLSKMLFATLDPKTNIVERLSKDDLIAEFIQFLSSADFDSVTQNTFTDLWDAKTALDAVELGINRLPVIAERDIVPIRLNSDRGLCYARISASEGETPLFDGFLSRLTINKSAVMQWIGNIFIHDSDRSQVLWMQGEGSDGKSQFFQALVQWINDQTIGKLQDVAKNGLASSIDLPRSGTGAERFFAASTVGKRLCIDYDTHETHFLKSNIIKKLTGDDFMSIEQKGVDAFGAMNWVKIVALSNFNPSIDDSRSNRRRLLYTSIKPFDGDRMNSQALKAAFIQEMPAIVTKCIRESLNNNPQRIPIPCEIPEEMLDTQVEIMSEFVKMHLVPSAPTKYLRSRFRKRMQHILEIEYGSKFTDPKRLLARFFDAVEKIYPGHCQVKKEHPGVMVVSGVAFRDATENTECLKGSSIRMTNHFNQPN